MATYLYDQAWELERLRLGALEHLFDDTTRQRLRAVGLGPGWRCLEVGAGAGSTARWLADQVGPTGRVVATDVDPRFVAESGSLEVRRHDILGDAIESRAYDLVHARALLEHLPEREHALHQMVSAVRPGGWVVVEDFHLGPVVNDMLAEYFSPVRELPVYRRLVAAFDRLFHARYADVEFAPQLPTMLLEAGLVDVTASMYAPIVRGGATERGFLELTLAYLGDRMVDKGLLTQAELDRMAAILRDPRSFHVPMPMVSAWGRRPG